MFSGFSLAVPLCGSAASRSPAGTRALRTITGALKDKAEAVLNAVKK
jgi:hypothetical protein